MDKALEQSLSTKPFVKGLLFADLNGLLITGKASASHLHSDCHDTNCCPNCARQISREMVPVATTVIILLQTNHLPQLSQPKERSTESTQEDTHPFRGKRRLFTRISHPQLSSSKQTTEKL